LGQLTLVSRLMQHGWLEGQGIQRIKRPASGLKVINASEQELTWHEERLDLVVKKGGSCLWRS